MQFINVYDFLLFFLYFIVLYFIIVARSRKLTDYNQRKFFLTAFLLHILGSFLYCMVVQYYYGYGDSFGFYKGSLFLRKLINNGDIFDTFFMSGDDFVKKFANNMDSEFGLPTGIQSPSNLTVMKISAILSYFSFNSYLVISMFFGTFAFAGIWKLFGVFREVLDPKWEKILAYTVLYTPSICFWGSGLMKDSLCLGLVGFISHFLYKTFWLKQHSLKNILFIIAFGYLLFLLKSYILSALIVASVFAYISFIITKSKDNPLKLSAIVVALLISFVFLVIGLTSTMESILEESKSQIDIFKDAYANSNSEDERSMAGFSPGDFELSVSGLVSKSPMAFTSALFRPFVWETRKPIMFFSALESLIMLIATVFVLYKCRFFKFFYYVFSDPVITFAFVFILLIAGIVGFTTFNFGTLVRYRLPILPFYFFMLIAVYRKVQLGKSAGWYKRPVP